MIQKLTKNRLSKLHRKLYEASYKEAKKRWVISSPYIKEYAQNFLATLPKKTAECTVHDIIENINENSIVLYGDFHTFKQSQKGFVRLIQSYISTHKKQRMVLALEMFHQKHQKWITRFQNGEIDEKKLIKMCQYEKTWGFPFNHYRFILEFAKEHKITIIGINKQPQESPNKLHMRDELITKEIKKIRSKYPQHVIFCLIGEYHLADQHLPFHLRKIFQHQENIVRIFCNVDQYNLKVSTRKITPNTRYLSLKDNIYCILNSPAWMKWESYILWEDLRQLNQETHEPSFTADPDIDFNEDTDEYDTEHHLVSMMKEIVEILELPVHSKMNHHFSAIYTDNNNIDRITKTRKSYDHDFSTQFHARLMADGFVFLPPDYCIITDLTLNNLACCAGALLHAHFQRECVESARLEQQFYERTIRYAASLIASKIFNPHRKAVDIIHYHQLINNNKGRKLKGKAQLLRETAKEVIFLHEWITTHFIDQHKVPKLPQRVTTGDIQNNFEISKAFGELIGYTLYFRTINQSVPHNLVHNIFTQTSIYTNTADFIQLYEQIMH